MDIARTDIARRKRTRTIVVSSVVLIVCAGLVYGLSRLKPAAVTVDRGSVLLDTVKRGSFQREIRGVGTLVPVKILVVAANVEGRVINRYVLPGAPMEPGMVMFDLANGGEPNAG
jgi:HlyD family secretion protein